MNVDVKMLFTSARTYLVEIECLRLKRVELSWLYLAYLAFLKEYNMPIFLRFKS